MYPIVTTPKSPMSWANLSVVIYSITMGPIVVNLIDFGSIVMDTIVIIDKAIGPIDLLSKLH